MSDAATILDATSGSAADPAKDKPKPSAPKDVGPLAAATRGMPAPQVPMSQQLAQDRADIAAKTPQMPVLQKPPSQTPQSDPWSAFSQPAMLIAILGSLFTRRPFVNAMNAADAVLTSTAQKDAEAAKAHFETWKVQTENGLKMAKFQQDAYNAAIKKMDVDAKAGKAELETNILAFKDEVLQQAYAHGGYKEVEKLLFARGKHAADTAGAQGGAAAILGAHVNLAANLNDPDPAKQADAVEMLRKSLRADASGKGSTVATRQSTDLNDIRLQHAENQMRSGDPAEVAKGQQIVEEILQLGPGALKPPSASAIGWKDGINPDTGENFRYREIPGQPPEYQDLSGQPIAPPSKMAHIGSSQPASITPDAAMKIAQAIKAGDTGAATGIARSSANIGMVNNALASIITDGKELAEAKLRFSAMQAGMRTTENVGARIDIGAQELKAQIPKGLAASARVPRWDAVPVNKMQQALLGASSDPDLADFSAQNRAIINAASQVFVRGGATTDSAREKAESILSSATSQESYKRVLNRLEIEANQALLGTKAAEKDLSDRFMGKEAPMGIPAILHGIPGLQRSPSTGMYRNPATGETWDADGVPQ